MNTNYLRITLSTAVATMLAIVGCSSAEPTSDDVVATVDTDEVDPNRKLGAKISSSSGYIGVGGGVIDTNPEPPPPQGVIGCAGTCYPDSSNTGCICPGGYGVESGVLCPFSAPYRCPYWGVYKCYSVNWCPKK